MNCGACLLSLMYWGRTWSAFNITNKLHIANLLNSVSLAQQKPFLIGFSACILAELLSSWKNEKNQFPL